MPEALLWLPIVVVVAGGASALRAVLARPAEGAPASVALLAPLSEAARAIRTRPIAPRGAGVERAAGAVLLVVAMARVALLPLDGRVLVDPLPGIALLLVGDAVAWACWWVLAAERVRPLAFVARAAAFELAVAVALAAPAVAAGALGAMTIVGGQRDALPFAVEMPAVLLVLLAVTTLTPWSAPAEVGLRSHLTGVDRLLADAARAVSLAAGCAVAVALLLPPGGAGRALLATAGAAVLLVVVARRVPVLRLERAARAALVVLLPVALVQLGLVVALTLLARG